MAFHPLHFRMSGVIDVAVEMELCTAPDYHPVDSVIVKLPVEI
jgi:hypothetical protein